MWPNRSSAGNPWRAQLRPLQARPGRAGPLLLALKMMSTLFVTRHRVRSSEADHVHFPNIFLTY